MGKASTPLDFRDFAGFYDWLKKHHATVPDARLLIYKKGSRHLSIGYEPAVRAALCWGWIDSTTWRHDERCFIQRFSPRKPTSNWSASNIRRMKELLAEGQVAEAGLAVFDLGLVDRLAAVERAEKKRRLAPAVLPEAAATILAEDREAAALFAKLPPSYRRQYCQWIADAKREPTKVRRARKMVQMLREGRKLSEL